MQAGELAPGSRTVAVRSTLVVGDRLFVTTSDRLLVVDDIATGPVEVPLPPGTSLPPWGIGGESTGDELLTFVVVPGGTALLATDGTAAGTRTIPLPPSVFPSPTTLVPTGGRFTFFAAPRLTGGPVQTWVTDGTAAGTVPYGPHEVLWAHHLKPRALVPAPAGGVFYAAIRHPEAGVEPHVIDVGAVAERIGDACGGVGRAPGLRAATVPALGTRCTLAGRSSAGSLAVVLIGLAPVGPTAFPAHGACTLQVAPASFVDLPAVPITGGRFTVGLDIPGDPALIGLPVAAQALVGPTDAALGVDLTNGLLLTVGR